MAGTPEFKVYSLGGEYVACFKYPSDAAAFTSILGDGASVRSGHNKKFTVWTEGSENFRAGESYDRAGELIAERLAEFRAALNFKISTPA